MRKKKSSSKSWIREHEVDPYVLAARSEGFRSRASYKLIELDERFNVLKRGMRALDLGCAPGGWSQVAISKIGTSGQLIASDILEMKPIKDVNFIQGDFTEILVVNRILSSFSASQIDLVMSDMAPNLSGVNAIDQPRSMCLAELAFDITNNALTNGGSFVVKLFHGEGFDAFVKSCRQAFEKVNVTKPHSSRRKSREVYLVGRGFYGGKQ